MTLLGLNQQSNVSVRSRSFSSKLEVRTACDNAVLPFKVKPRRMLKSGT
jgi:hypothetical protein